MHKHYDNIKLIAAYHSHNMKGWKLCTRKFVKFDVQIYGLCIVVHFDSNQEFGTS